MSKQIHADPESNAEEGNTLQLRFDEESGLMPVSVQETSGGRILMLAYVNRDALNQTIKTGFASFWSRSRGELWVKGLTSGNTLKIDEILVDCDQDALVYRVTPQAGGACHTKNRNDEYRRSCFYRKIDLTDLKLSFKTDYPDE
ncbi:MAG: phosphoribosyl-AMP cyclohydrolase [Balneolaceae bacterium]|nr:MAG: phosphoribosyl-AMP cyclohydrolase [Balneolaceae bacterium]